MDIRKVALGLVGVYAILGISCLVLYKQITDFKAKVDQDAIDPNAVMKKMADKDRERQEKIDELLKPLAEKFSRAMTTGEPVPMDPKLAHEYMKLKYGVDPQTLV